MGSRQTLLSARDQNRDYAACFQFHSFIMWPVLGCGMLGSLISWWIEFVCRWHISTIKATNDDGRLNQGSSHVHKEAAITSTLNTGCSLLKQVRVIVGLH